MSRLPILFLAIASLAQAQQLANPAHLWVEILANGSERATLTLPAANMPEQFAPILSRAVGCNETPPEPSRGDFRIRVYCRVQRSAQLRFRFNAQLTELTDALGAAGAGSLEILITAENFEWTRTNAAITRYDIRSGAYYMQTYALSAVPPAIELEAGFGDNSLSILVAGVFGLLLLPCLLLAMRPSNMIQLHATVQGLFIVGCAGWVWVLQQSQAFALCTFLFPQWMLAPLFALTAPPLFAVWFGSRFAAAHHSKFVATSTRAHSRLRFWMGAALTCALSGFANLLGATGSPIEPFASVVASLLPAILCLARLVHLARGGSRPLPEGELHARLFSLAEQAGVRLRGITLLTSIEPKPPVALATRWGVVILNESLLLTFSRREVDAIVCHELSHINAIPKGAMPNATITVAWFLITSTVLASQFVKGVADITPLLMLSAYFLFKLWRRGEERKADLDSVRWCGDPEGLIMGLARMSYANSMPLEWSAPISWFVSHPSTMERFQAIARAGGVSVSRIEELLVEARRETDEIYPLEQDITEDAAFPPALRRTLQTRLTRYGLLSPVGIALPVVWFLQFAGFEGWDLFALASLLAMVAFYLLFEQIAASVRGNARLRALAKYGEGTFVGFTPYADPRIYNGMFHYDFGLVRASGQSLEFIGDRLRFTLDRRLVPRVWIGNGPRHYAPRKVVCIEYRPSPDAPLAVFSIQSFDAALWPNTESAARRLCLELETWLRGTSNLQAPPEPCALLQDRGESYAALSLFTAIKYAGMHFGVAFLLDSSFGAIWSESNWNPLHPLVPALVAAALSIFVFFPKIRLTGAGAGAIRKAEAN